VNSARDELEAETDGLALEESSEKLLVGRAEGQRASARRR